MSNPAQFALPFLIEPPSAPDQSRLASGTPGQLAEHQFHPLVSPVYAGQPRPAGQPAEQRTKIYEGGNQSQKGTPRAKKPATEVPPTDGKVLASRKVAAHMLSISVRAVDYLIATKKLATRRIGTRVMIPVEEIRRFARSDHPERMAG